MTIKDKEKWNKKYKETPSLLTNRSPSDKLKKVINLTNGNKALEIACGTGRNAIYLAQNNFIVDALDISEVALNFLDDKKIPNITTKIVDFDDYIPQRDSYNLIIMTNFLDRNIISCLKSALKKDGILFIETYMYHPSNNKPNSNPDFLLKNNELKTFFDKNFEIIEYSEFDNEPYEIYKMRKQSIIVKKI